MVCRFRWGDPIVEIEKENVEISAVLNRGAEEHSGRAHVGCCIR